MRRRTQHNTMRVQWPCDDADVNEAHAQTLKQEIALLFEQDSKEGQGMFVCVNASMYNICMLQNIQDMQLHPTCWLLAEIALSQNC